MIFHLAIAALAYSVIEASNIKASLPPPKTAIFPRLRVIATLPNLQELTFCSWVKIRQLNGSNLAPVLSYSTPRNNNEFIVALFNRSGNAIIRIYRGAILLNSDCELNCQIGSWCHICVSWLGDNGRVDAFVNGNKCKKAFLNFNKTYVPTGGVLVIGQEQDGLDSNYDINQAFIGDIADFQLWDEVLSEDQIKEAGTCGGKRKQGNVVSWLKTPMIVLDGVVLSATQLCLP